MTDTFDMVIDTVVGTQTYMAEKEDTISRLFVKWKIKPKYIIFYDHGTGEKYGVWLYNTTNHTWTELRWKDVPIPRNSPAKSAGYVLVQHFLKIWEIYPDAVIVTENGTFVASGGLGNPETRFFLEHEMNLRNIPKAQLRWVDNRLVANESKAHKGGKKTGIKELDENTHVRDAKYIGEEVLRQPGRAKVFRFNKKNYPKKRHRSVRPMDDDYNHPCVLMYVKKTYDINDPIWSDEAKNLFGEIVSVKGKKGKKILVWHLEHILPLLMAFEEQGVNSKKYFMERIIGAFDGGPKSFYRKARDYLNIKHFAQLKGDDYKEPGKPDKNGKIRLVKKHFTGRDWGHPSRPIVEKLLQEFHKNTLQFHIENNIMMGSDVKVTIREYYWGRYGMDNDPESYLNMHWIPSYPNTPAISFEEFYQLKEQQ